MKKILLLILSFGLLFGASKGGDLDNYEPNEKNFRDGFEAGISALKFQSKNDGFQQTVIKLNKKFLLVFDISDVPHHEALFYQIISAREGFDTHFTKEFISLGEFEREIDAVDARNLLMRKYNFNNKNLKVLKDRKIIVTYPFLFDSFYKMLIQEAKERGIIVETQIVEIEKPKVIPKKVIKKSPPKKLVKIKNNKAMSYAIFGDKQYSKNFRDAGLIEHGNKTYEYEETITTIEGEKFIKTKDGVYFAITDVKIENER